MDSVPIEVTVKKATVAIWGYPKGNPGARDILGRCLTGDDGGFDITVYLEDSSLWVIYEVLYPTGPNSTNAGLSCIKTSDPTGPYPGWKLPEDTTVWHFTADSMFFNVTPGIPHDFGKAYVDTTPREQPRSGAVNIYNTLLKGYEYLVPNFTSPDTIKKVRALWEPGYGLGTGCKPSVGDTDTIYVQGDSITNTDEWDDGPLLHEFGHHVMYRCAEIPPDINPLHYWWNSDSFDSNTAYAEGWPTFFYALVTDSLYYINTRLGPGGGTVSGWHNIEEPWVFSDLPPDSFKGRPWCVGAVAGVLWDICDSFAEVPYDTHPLLPEWPDTNLADTLSLGFDEIWTISDTFDPPPPDTAPNNCWSVRHFITAWLSREFNYGHEAGLQHILEHHRIEWDFGPNPPKNLRDKVVPQKPEVELQYSPPDTYELVTSSPPAAGYCIYRRQPGDTLFSRLATPTDTTWVDSAVEANQNYIYTVTAYDAGGYMSDTSNNVTIWVPGSEDSLATAHNNAQKIAWDEKDSVVYVAFSSGDSVYCEISTNFGDNWSKTSVGEGAYPTIALAPDGDPWMVWLGNYGWGTDSLLLAYRSILCAQYSGGSWSEPDSIYTYEDNDSLQCVSFSTDTLNPTGYGHVVATYMKDIIDTTYPPDTIHCIDSFLEYLRFPLDDSLSNVTRQLVSSASVGTPPPLITLASVAADTSGLPHIAWERWFPWDPGRQGPVHAILYKCGEDIPDTVEWDGDTNTLSDLALDSYHPYIEFHTCHKRISTIWDAFDTTSLAGYQVESRFKINRIWNRIKRVTRTAGDARLPAVSGDYAVWSEWAIDGPAQIFKAKYDSVSETWDPPETLFVSDEASIYPHTVFAQALTDTFLFTCWTEGDSTPYSIAFNVDTVQGAGFKGTYYVDAGRPIPSPYLIHRGGYQDWGGLPQLTVDTDPRLVSYRFTGLDRKASYHLTTAHYFQPPDQADIVDLTPDRSAFASDSGIKNRLAIGWLQGRKIGTNLTYNLIPPAADAALHERPNICSTTENVAPVGHDMVTHRPAQELVRARQVVPVAPANWVLGIRLDGESCGEVNLPPRSLTRFECEVPQASVADGILTVEIARLAGEYALVSELYLYEVGGRDAGSVRTDTQLSSESRRNRFRFQGLSPNPSRGNVQLDYEVPRQCDVSLDIFDVAGRLVRAVSQVDRAAGMHVFAWDLRTSSDAQAPGGVYFLRLTARNRLSNAEEFSFTRKLVLIR